MYLSVAPCAFLGRFERYWASYKKWKGREGEEIEGRKPSWLMGKTHHTLSAIKSSHALRSAQELASNRPDASSDRQTDQKNHSLPEYWRKINDISEFLLCHIPELTSHDTNRLSHDLVLRLQVDEPINDQALSFPHLNLQSWSVIPNIFRNWFLLFRVVPLSFLQCQGVLCSSSDIEKKKSTYVRYLSQCHFDQSLTVTWPGNQKAWPLVSWLVNSGIWQRRNTEMSLIFLQCTRSEWFFGQFADQKKHLAYCWRVLGPIEERGLILWLKVCDVFFTWTKMASYLLSLLLPLTFHFL